MSEITQRMIRAAKLDPELYEEVEADEQAMGQAMAVVVLSSVAAGIGMPGGAGLFGIVVGSVVAVAGWYIWAYIAFFIGTRLFPEPQTHADLGQLLRTTGFSAAPGLIRVLGVIPGLGIVTAMIAGSWMLVAMVIAIRQALDYQSTARAVAVCVVGFLAYLVVFGVMAAVFGGLAAG